MVHKDAEELAQVAWDATADVPYAACQLEHQLRLCTVVNSIAEQVELGSDSPTADVAGLELFEAEVIKRLTMPAPKAPKQLKAADKKGDK